MTEPTPTPAPDQAAQPTADATPDAAEPQQDSTDWKAEARKWETRAKENNAKAAEFEKARKAAMTDTERAVAEAEERGRTTATATFGQRLVKSDFIAAAARRNPDFDATSILDDLNLARYVGEDGEPNSNEIAKAVERLIPEGGNGTPTPPSFDGGTRQPATAGVGMSQLIRKAAGRA